VRACELVLGQLFVFKTTGTLLIMNEADALKTRSLLASWGFAAEVSKAFIGK